MSEESSSPLIKLIPVAMGVTFVFAGGLIAAGATMVASDPSTAMGSLKVTGSLAGASTIDTGDSNYKPSSAYIEEGADSEITTMSFGKGAEKADPNIPQQLADATIQNTINSHQNKLMTCYAEALQHEDLQGKVAMKFAIAPDGHVAMVKVTRSSLRSKSTEDCLVNKARAFSFPRHSSGQLAKFETSFTFAYE